MLSIIIPIYNGSKFIQRSYENILNQNLTDFEIIYVDNNSTDNSLELLNNLAANEQRIRIFKEEKQGAASARNKGIVNSRGDLIQFFDVDDYIVPGSLVKMISILRDYPDCYSIFGETRRVRELDLSESNRNIPNFEIIEPPGLGMKWAKNLNSIPGPSAFIHRKILFQQEESFNENLMLGEDAEFHIRLGLNYNLIKLDDIVHQYFRHSDSTVSKQNKVEEKVFTYWDRIVNAHLPYVIKNTVPVNFEKLVAKKVYGSIIKMLYLTKGLTKRSKLKKRLFKQIDQIPQPILFHIFSNIIILFPLKVVYKIYVYYIIKYHKLNLKDAH